jgi:transposase-like protein
VSEIDQDAVRADVWKISDLDGEHVPGEEAVGAARRRVRHFKAAWSKAYPGAIATVIDGLDELVVHLDYPRAHWARIQHTNPISVDRTDLR